VTLDAKGGSGLGGGLDSLLVIAPNNLALFLTPSKKTYNFHQKE
jgi:hypothetical protein